LLIAARFKVSDEAFNGLFNSFEVVLALGQAELFDFCSSNADLSLALLDVHECRLGFSFGVSVEDDDHLGLLQVLRGVHWHHLQESFSTEKLLVLALFVNKLRSCESSAFKPGWFGLDLDVPLFPFLHLEQLLDHGNNGFHLLLRILLDFVEQEPHVLAVVSD
jgi:hypothetical protein